MILQCSLSLYSLLMVLLVLLLIGSIIYGSSALIFFLPISAQGPAPQAIGVKITSPVKGQEVLTATKTTPPPSTSTSTVKSNNLNNNNLMVSGTSTDDVNTDCQVSVIVNNVKPYQPAVANGTGGTNDYSTWNFMITPTYTTIKEGPNNKITSKLECTPNLTKWYSVNVTGVNTTTTTTTNTNTNRAETAMQTPFVLFPLPIMPDDDNNNNITDSISTRSSTNTSNSFSTGSVGYPSKSSLSISLNVTSNSAVSGDDQTIEATVLDAVSHLQIDSAILELEITDSAGNTIEEFSDDDGSISYTFEVGAEGTEEEDGETVIPGIFTATLRASAVGYEPESKTTTFNLVEQDEVVEDNNNDIIDDEEDLSIGDSNSGNELFE